MNKTFRITWLENRSIELDAESKENAIELVKRGEFDEVETYSNGVDLATIEAEEVEKNLYSVEEN